MRNKEKNIIENNSSIFEFIKPDNNDKFHEMKNIDLLELICHIENYYLELRKNLGFGKSVSFGLELEFEHAMKKKIEDKLKEHPLTNSWKVVGDGSLTDGAEINSPILKDEKKSWDALDKVCSIVKMNARIDENSGGHIHIGRQILENKEESWLNFIKIWSVYENIIFRFTYGDFLFPRKTMKKHAPPVADILWENYMYLLKNKSKNLNQLIRILKGERRSAVNFNNIKTSNFFAKDTIEFRCPNGTLEPVIWQNNANLFFNLLKYSKSPNYDDDTIMARKNKNDDMQPILELYNEIYLDQALEFCDLVFTNNLDKVYFLRQYLKSFDIGSKPLQKSKTFIKK